jgi:hypothetical protein
MSKRLSARPTKVYGYDAKSSTDECVSESESGDDGPPVPIPIQSSCVHKASGRVWTLFVDGLQHNIVVADSPLQYAIWNEINLQQQL